MVRDSMFSRIHGIREETVGADTAFLTRKAGRLHSWWHRTAAGRLPLRREFDVLDHWDMAPNLFLVEALPGGQFLMRLQGESVISLFGANSTGQLISEAAALGEFGQAIHEHYSGTATRSTCRRCVGTLERVGERSWISFESLDCPLSRDGTGTDFILGVVEVIEQTTRAPRLTGD
ncbi:PAS domain-containing protein [Arenibaculum pallidiluteum]|uniref:hypothetical protein n=1 Tax=Arenibaculum pallidiluteum TaxID=2812559 RepID=UPI001A96498C|nr:hypothetical protein [Arenibaculum pallidiluteum]